MNWIFALLAWIFGISPAQMTEQLAADASSEKMEQTAPTNASTQRVHDKKHGGGIIIIDDTHYTPPGLR
jgi:hypothetical protein